MSGEIVAVVGAGRSGTSILGEVIAEAGYTLYFEPGVKAMREAEPPCIFKLPRTDDATEGLTFDLSWFVNRFPTARFVWIVRNPYDHACSLRKGLGAHVWRHPPYPRNLENWIDKTTLEKSVEYWRLTNVTGLATLRAFVGDVMVVRYEDLVQCSLRVATRLLKWLGRDSQDAMRLVQTVSNCTADHQAAKQDRWDANPTKVRIGRYRTDLTPEEARWIAERLDVHTRVFGYPTAGEILKEMRICNA